MNDTHIRHLVFDFSDTLARFDGPAFMARLCGGDAAAAERIYGNVFADPVWARYDLGQIGTAETRRALLAGYRGAEREILDRYLAEWTEHYRPMEGMEPLLRRLKGEGYRLYLLSDFPEVFPRMLEKFPFLKEFDGRMISCEVGMSKRQGAAIFHHLLKTFGLRPEECFYADDLPVNIVSARAAGMKGYIFQSAEGYREALEKARRSE